MISLEPTNLATAPVANTILITDLTITLGAGYGNRFSATGPSPALVEEVASTGVIVKSEVVNVTGRNGDILTVTRASEPCPSSDTDPNQSQTALEFNNPTRTRISLVFSAKIMKDIRDEVNGKLPTSGGTRTGMGLALGDMEITSAGVEIKRVRNDVGSLTSTDIITGIDPSTRARKEVPYSALLADMTSGSFLKGRAGESLLLGDIVYKESLLDFRIILAEISTGITSSYLTHVQRNIGDVTANTTRSMTIIGNGITSSNIKLALKKTGSPADNVTIRIETDNGSGNPSGTLAHVNATANIAGSGLSNVATGIAESTGTWAGTFSLTDGAVYHIVVGRSGGIDPTNYYNIGFYTRYTRSFVTNVRNGTTWGTAVTTHTMSVTFSGCYSEVYVKASASQTASAYFKGVASTNMSRGDQGSFAIPGGIANLYAGLTKSTPYYLSNTPGLISTTPGTIGVLIGTSDSLGTGIIIGTSEDIEFNNTLTRTIWSSAASVYSIMFTVTRRTTIVHTSSGGSSVLYYFATKNGVNINNTTFVALPGDIIYIGHQTSAGAVTTTISEVLNIPRITQM